MTYQQQQSQVFPTYPTESSEDINWAQLAQRWIQTQHSQQQSYQTQPPPPPPPPPSRVSSASLFHGMPPPPPPNRTPGPGFFPTPLSHVSVGPPQTNWRPMQNWTHPFNKGYQSHGMTSTPNYSYFSQSQGSSNRQDDEEYQAHYDPSLEQEESSDQRPRELCATVSAVSQWMANPWNAGMCPPNYMPIIDTQMRKKLPAWILEGLEKAEREKQKKMEKEEFEKKRKEREEEKRRQRESKGIGKFEEDSDGGEDGEDDGKEINDASNKNAYHSLPIRKFREFVDENKANEEEEVEDSRTDEQRAEEALMVVKRLMTTVLLETTNKEFERIADDVLTRGKAKAQPKILAQSTALAALTSLYDNDGEKKRRRSRSRSPTKKRYQNTALALTSLYDNEGERKRRRSRSRSPTKKRYQTDSSTRR